MHTRNKTFDCHLAKRWIQQIGLYPRSSHVQCSVLLSTDVAVVYQQFCLSEWRLTASKLAVACSPLGLAVISGTEPKTYSNGPLVSLLARWIRGPELRFATGRGTRNNVLRA
jgi:hypothetical protein